ncbi:hypothetical protein HQQ94_19100 [Shewanella sp. VB17]|uniref:hypothetical protein n=1 Tax=Shewanella sp. VB17 TaxID=2739432 RepID=UPI0015656DB8|nr:hypothetical protein [Shewanella sp. VB17]NRD75291.1 hypothetical protein [Shewanella sp. VB17]
MDLLSFEDNNIKNSLMALVILVSNMGDYLGVIIPFLILSYTGECESTGIVYKNIWG